MRYYLEPISNPAETETTELISKMSRTTANASYGDEFQSQDSRFEVDLPAFKKESDGAIHKGFVSTFVFARRNEPYFLLGLDCDDMDGMLETTRELEFRKMDNLVIESSPFHFWVLVNFAGVASQCISIMKTIPGIDSKYIEWTEKRGDFFLRGFPKNGFKPRFKVWDTSGMLWKDYNVFESWSWLGKWSREFYDLWNCKEFNRLYYFGLTSFFNEERNLRKKKRMIRL